MEAGFKWSPKQSPAMLDVSGLEKILSSVVNTKSATQLVDPKDGAQAVSLDSVTLYPPSKPEFLCLLFSFTDEKGADPGFKNLLTNKKRTEKKKLDEANAASAHLLISLKEKVRKKYSYYPAMIEDVAGIGKTKILLAINKIIAAKKTFSFKDEDGNVRAAAVRMEMTGLDDEKVSNDAENGRLSYFVAIRELKGNPSFDDSLAVTQTREEVKLKPLVTDINPKTFKQRLNALASVAKEKGYDRVQVHYVRGDGKNRSITFGTHREDSEDFLIKRIEKIGLNNVVGQSHDTPSAELVAAMAKRLRK